MNRDRLYKYISDNLNSLVSQISSNSKLNLNDTNIFSEYFIADLTNLVFGLNLENANKIKQNIEGFDLIDNKNKILIQVSSECTKSKIEKSLQKEVYSSYQGYKFKFVSLSNQFDKIENLKKYDYETRYGIVFNPKEDIWSIVTYLKEIESKNIDDLMKIEDFIRKELDPSLNIDTKKLDSSLANIIQIIADEVDLGEYTDIPNSLEFKIEKKISFNNLEGIEDIIKDFSPYEYKVDEIYRNYDENGKNRSFATLQKIRELYFKAKKELTGEDIFYKVCDDIKQLVLKSPNFDDMTDEELEIYIRILVVDAFIKCKIFKHPKEE